MMSHCSFVEVTNETEHDARSTLSATLLVGVIARVTGLGVRKRKHGRDRKAVAQVRPLMSEP